MDGKIRLTILPRRSEPKFKIKLTRDDIQDINLRGLWVYNVGIAGENSPLLQLDWKGQYRADKNK